MRKLIFGCGYLGQRVARKWLEAGDHVTIVSRSESRAAEFRRQGYAAIVADVTQPQTLTPLPAADTVLFAVGHDRSGGQSIMDVYECGMRNVLDSLPAATGRFIYISTTGVYGPAGGEWIDEDTPPDPQRDGGRASLAAEQALAAHRLGERSVVLRLAGIYGPGRVPFLKELLGGQPIAVPSTGYLNLIHVDDAAGVLLAAAELLTARGLQSPAEIRNAHQRLYCVSDGHPIARREFYAEAARLLNAPAPRFIEPAPDSPRAGRARGDRRVRNDKMLSELRVKLEYPDYRAGLAAVLETENQ